LLLVKKQRSPIEVSMLSSGVSLRPGSKNGNT